MYYRGLLWGPALLVIVFMLSTTVVSGQTGANIYQIVIENKAAAEAAAQININAFLRLSDGYLVQALPEVESDLNKAGIPYRLVADNINRTRLALDVRSRHRDQLDYPVVYQDDGLCLYDVDPQVFRSPIAETGVTPVLTDNLPITYQSIRMLDMSQAPDLVDLDSLAASALVDSCTSYVMRLQDFQTRLVGSDSNYASRDWLIDKFHQFGYDSVITDTFMANIAYNSLTLATCHNVIAYKIGSVYPDHQIVIGAHRDAYPLESPGADDNASGTSGVLEIARVLSGLDPKMTFVFVLFDAEETGLHGSWKYVTRAFDRGDSIALMINMDVIGYYTNSDMATVGQAPWTNYGDLYSQLADSLPSINLTVDLITNAMWDAAPFQMNAYNSMTACEYNFNNRLHSAHDSADYVNFDYMTRVIRGSLVTAYVVNETYTPDPMLKFSYPDGCPDYLYPSTATSFNIYIEGYAGGVIESGSPALHYAVDGGEFQSIQLSEIGGSLFQATIPAQPCNTRVSYYVTARETGGDIFYSVDPQNPHRIATGLEAEVVAAYDFEEYLGWLGYGTASRGLWSQWRPRGYDGVGRPGVDFDGSGHCYVTGPESEPWEPEGVDVDDGVTILRSPTLDLSGGQILVEYARWYSNNAGNAPYSDVFEVKISGDDGATWVTAETVGPFEQSSGKWFRHSIWVNDFIEPTSQMRVRFDASDYGDDSNIEAGLDALKITRFYCGPAVTIVTENMDDWTEGVPISTALEASGGYGAVIWDDVNDDLSGTGMNLGSDGTLSGTPNLPGSISFTALATDELGQFDQHQYDFTINPAPAVTTESLPDGATGVAYSHQLTATGGTGAIVWSDLSGDLVPTGLELSSDGLLTGVPADTGTFTFTARISDAVGAEAQRLLSVFINLPYICGDANGDGQTNVGDAVFLINYVFKSGPAPVPIQAGDANWDGEVNVGDAVFLINFVFNGGPAPDC